MFTAGMPMLDSALTSMTVQFKSDVCAAQLITQLVLL
jgi:hypothetical protein